MNDKDIYLAVEKKSNIIDLDSVRKIKENVNKKIKKKDDNYIDVCSLELLEEILCINCLEKVCAAMAESE